MIFIINRVFFDSDAGRNSDSLLGYVVSEEKAIEKTAKLNELHEEAKKVIEQIEEHYMKIIVSSVETEPAEEYPQCPKWRPGIKQSDITKEMREERNRILKLQEEVSNRNNKKHAVRQSVLQKLKQEYIDSLHINSDVLELMKSEEGYDSVLCYSYEKVEELS